MCAKKSDKVEKAAEETEVAGKNSSISLLSAALKENKEDHYNGVKQVEWKVSTGSLILDRMTGGVKPSLWRLAGQNNSGKTPQTLEIIRNILKDVPNSKALWVIAEGRGLSEENVARSGLKFVENPDDWAIGTVFVLKSNIFELFINLIKDLVKKNEEDIRYAFVVDSIDGMMLRDDSKKEINEANKVAGVPALSKKMLQSLSLGMFTHGHFLALISQVTSEIKIDPYAKTANRGGSFSGGNSLLHGSDVIIQYEPSFQGDFILDDPKGKMNDGKTKTVGQNVKVTMIKSLLEETRKQSFTYPIKYGRKPGIWIEREVADLILGFGLAVRGGSWITFSDVLIKELTEAGITDFPAKIQGENQLYDLLSTNKPACDYLYTKFSRMM